MPYSHFYQHENSTNSQSFTQTNIEQILQKPRFNSADLPALLSDAASKKILLMAARAENETRTRFGANVQFFLPLYLSNLCTNICSYCGFSAEQKVKRAWLRPKDIDAEISAIKTKGIQHLLLVTGEAEHKIGVEYFAQTLQQIQPHFAHIQLEAQPMSTEDYATLQLRGLDGVVVYQETYNKHAYEKVHLRGKKADFEWRLNTPDRIAQAGIEKIGLGILLGLNNWREDAIALAAHLQYLQKTYWQQRYSVGFPRLRPCASNFAVPNPVNDKQLIQIILAFRLCFPDVDIVLSTREPLALRNALLTCGITQMSAESSTQPGGYSRGTPTHLEQFAIDDSRSFHEIKQELQKQNFHAIFADNIPVKIPTKTIEFVE